MKKIRLIMYVIIVIVSAESLNAELKIRNIRSNKLYRYGESIIVHLDILNIYKDKGIILDLQPFLLLSHGKKNKSLRCFVYRDRKGNNFMCVNILNVTDNSTFNGNVPVIHTISMIGRSYKTNNYALIMKSGSRFTISIKLDKELYLKYFEKGVWKLSAEIAWDVVEDRKYSYKETFKGNQIVTSIIDNYSIVEIPVIKNFDYLIDKMNMNDPKRRYFSKVKLVSFPKILVK